MFEDIPTRTVPPIINTTLLEGSTTEILGQGANTNKVVVPRQSQNGLVAVCVILALALIVAIVVFSVLLIRERRLRYVP